MVGWHHQLDGHEFEQALEIGKVCGQEEKWTTEDEMAGWHHRLDEHEFE